MSYDDMIMPEDLLDRRLYVIEDADFAIGVWDAKQKSFWGLRAMNGTWIPESERHFGNGYTGRAYAVADLGIDLGKEIRFATHLGVYTEQGLQIYHSDIKGWCYDDGEPIAEGVTYKPAMNEDLIYVLKLAAKGREDVDAA